jgi:hypothetical protein
MDGLLVSGDFVGKLEKLDGAFEVGRLPQVNTHPAASRKDVVGFRAAGGHQLIANFFWKRNVHEGVAVHVADFPSPQTVFLAAKAMRLGFNARPTAQDMLDFCSGAGYGHEILVRCQQSAYPNSMWLNFL